MTPQETEQVAALRMHVAHLVNGASLVLAHLERVATGPLVIDSDFVREIKACEAALAESEPSVRDLLAEADRDAKLKACREQLAETTARLALVEGAARACSHCPGCEGAGDECGVTRLDEALQ